MNLFHEMMHFASNAITGDITILFHMVETFNNEFAHKTKNGPGCSRWLCGVHIRITTLLLRFL